jgi:hypothetical protein
LLFGRTLFVVWLDLIDLGSRFLGLNESAIFLIVGGLLLIYMIIGSAAGWLAWLIASQLKVRLGRG